MKKKRVNRAKRAVAQPRFRPRVEKPAKGPGAYRRKPKQPSGDPDNDSSN